MHLGMVPRTTYEKSPEILPGEMCQIFQAVIHTDLYSIKNCISGDRPCFAKIGQFPQVGFGGIFDISFIVAYLKAWCI